MSASWCVGLQRFQHRNGRWRVAQTYCQVAQPALVTGPAQGRAFGAAQKFVFVPHEQFGQFGVVQVVPGLEVALAGRAGEAVPRADDDLLMVQIGSGFKTKGVDRSLKALAALPGDREGLRRTGYQQRCL